MLRETAFPKVGDLCAAAATGGFCSRPIQVCSTFLSATQCWLQPKNIQPWNVSKPCGCVRSTKLAAVLGVPSAGGREWGRRPTGCSARAGMSCRNAGNTGQRRTEERVTKAAIGTAALGTGKGRQLQKYDQAGGRDSVEIEDGYLPS